MKRRKLMRTAKLRLGALALVGALAGSFAAPRSAQAWDPSTTAQAILDAAVRRASLHVRWMEGSKMQFGLFSPVRLDPARLDPQTRRWLKAAIASSHADVGAVPRGGPGACPGAIAPRELMRHCVNGDLWELSALGWMRLGILLEGNPQGRMLHHFLDLEDPSASTWRDSSDLRPTELRRALARANSESVAGRWTGSDSRSGARPSAVAFLTDPTQALGPHAVAAHQRLSRLDADPSVRAHHRAMALLATGATLRVVMDAGLPAFARGDARAFTQALSPAAGDRGNAMVEYVRAHYGRQLPIEGVAAGTRPSGQPGAPSLVDHLVTSDAPAAMEGLATFSARHFVSAGNLPAERFVPAAGKGTSALRTWLADDDLGLDPLELDGAQLTPWPAPRGYAVNSKGRPLFAFERDSAGMLHAFVDDAIYADAASHLLPRVVDTAASALELLHGGVPGPAPVADGLIWQFELRPDHRDASLYVMSENADQVRAMEAKLDLRPGETNRVVGVPAAAEGTQRVFVLQWTGPDGIVRTAEHRP